MLFENVVYDALQMLYWIGQNQHFQIILFGGGVGHNEEYCTLFTLMIMLTILDDPLVKSCPMCCMFCVTLVISLFCFRWTLTTSKLPDNL